MHQSHHCNGIAADVYVGRKSDVDNKRKFIIVVVDIAERDKYFNQSKYWKCDACCRRIPQCITDNYNNLYRNRNGNWRDCYLFSRSDRNSGTACSDVYVIGKSDVDNNRKFIVAVVDNAKRHRYFNQSKYWICDACCQRVSKCLTNC